MVGADHAIPLVAAITAGDADGVRAVLSAAAGIDPGRACVVARSYRCPACDTPSVDVVAKASGMENPSGFSLLQPTSVTEPFDDALRGEPVPTGRFVAGPRLVE